MQDYMKKIALTLALLLMAVTASQAQLQKVYDEEIDPMAQIDDALAKARVTDRYVICQVGGNWCPWCLRFADFIQKDEEISRMIAAAFEYIHVNYPRKGAPEPLLQRLGNPGRFGYPVFVVLDAEGNVIHIQDSSFLEEGNGYNRDKVLRFFECWTPLAVSGE